MFVVCLFHHLFQKMPLWSIWCLFLNFLLSSMNRAYLVSFPFSAHFPSASLLRYSNVTTHPQLRNRKWWRTSSMLCAPAWCWQPIGRDSSEGKGFSLWILCSGETVICHKVSRFHWMDPHSSFLYISCNTQSAHKNC